MASLGKHRPRLCSRRRRTPRGIFPDGNLVAVCIGNIIEIRRAADGILEKKIGEHSRPTCSVGWSPDESLLAVTTVGETDDLAFPQTLRNLKPQWRAESEIYLWQTADGKLRARCNGHRMHVVGVEFSPDGRRLLSFGTDDTMRLWDTSDGAQVAEFETDVLGGDQNRRPARLGGFTREPPALVTSEPGEICIRDPLAGRRITTIDTLNAYGSSVPIAVSPRGRLAFCSRDVLADAAALWRHEESIKRKAEGLPSLSPQAGPVDPKQNGGDYLMTARLLPFHGAGVKVEGVDTQVVLRGARGKIIDDRQPYDAVYFSNDGKRAVTYRRNTENVTEAGRLGCDDLGENPRRAASSRSARLSIPSADLHPRFAIPDRGVDVLRSGDRQMVGSGADHFRRLAAFSRGHEAALRGARSRRPTFHPRLPRRPARTPT